MNKERVQDGFDAKSNAGLGTALPKPGAYNIQEEAARIDQSQAAKLESGAAQLESSSSKTNEPNEEGLAIATMVAKEDNEAVPNAIPATEEYDPNSKPPLYKTGRFRFYLCVAGTVLVAVVLAIALGVTYGKKEKKVYLEATPVPTTFRDTLGFVGIEATPVPTTFRDTLGFVDIEATPVPTTFRDTLEFVGIEATPVPTTFRDTLGFVDVIADAIGSMDLLEQEGSPHYRAAKWIINDDPLQLEVDAPNLIQRFALAAIYFSTTNNANGKWKSCNPSNETNDTNCIFQQFRSISADDVVEYLSYDATRWLSLAHECEWAGIECNANDFIKSITLEGNDITGTLPLDMIHLKHLTSITLRFNNLYGTLPSQWGSLEKLTNLDVHSNKLSGSIPVEWWKLPSLKFLDIGNNKFSGSLGVIEPGYLSNGKGLAINKNEFSGTLPTEIALLSSLKALIISENTFTGAIPTEIGTLKHLTLLRIFQNSFVSTIPTQVGDLSSLDTIDFHNTSIGGTIPEQLYTLPKLRVVDGFDANITGTISTSIGNLTKLTSFRVSNNKLFGTIPSELGLITNLRDGWFDYNDLTGTVPLEVCANANNFRVFIADCAPDECTGQIKVECPLMCCTRCCAPITHQCFATLWDFG